MRSCLSFQCALYILLRATKHYLEPASGTPQSTRCSRSSRTLPRGSGGDTCPHPPAHGGRREELGSRSDIDLQPRRPAFSPEIQRPLNTEDKYAMMHSHIQNSPLPHPLSARVHALVHRHVLDDRREGKCQRDIVRPVETPFENGAAV